MSGSLAGQNGPASFPRLLQIADGSGITGALQRIRDGQGDPSALWLSSGAASVTGLFTVDGTAVIPYLAPGEGAVSRTVSSRLDEAVNAADFGAIPDGVTDATAAFNAMMAAAVERSITCVLIPPGNYTVSGEIVIPHGVTRIDGVGAKITQTASASVFTRYGDFQAGGDSLSGMAAGARIIGTTSTVTAKYAEKDWVLLRANNLIPSQAAGSRVSVIRQITSLSTTVLRFDAPVNRLMDSGLSVRKMFPAPPITLRGLTIEHASMDNKVALVSFFATLDPTFIECRIGNNGGPAVRLIYTINGEWISSHTYNLRDDEDNGYFGYGMALAGAVRGFRFTSGTATQVRHAITTLNTSASVVPSQYVSLLDGRGEPESCVYGPSVHAYNTTNLAFDTHEQGYNILIMPNATGCFGGVNIRCTNAYIVGGMLSGCRREGIRISNTGNGPSIPMDVRVVGTTIDNVGSDGDRRGIFCDCAGGRIELEGVRVNGAQFGIEVNDGTTVTMRDVIVDAENIASSVGVRLAGQNADIDGLIIRNSSVGIQEDATGAGNSWTRYKTQNVTTPVSRVPTYASAPPTPFPVYTTTQRDALASPQAGWVIFNTTTGTVQAYNGSAWV